MGLDNIPHRYACERLGTAVKVDILDKDGVAIVDEETGLSEKRIDCRATQAEGKCPYLISLSKTDLQDGSVTGIFGTDCCSRQMCPRQNQHGKHPIWCPSSHLPSRTSPCSRTWRHSWLAVPLEQSVQAF